MSKRTYQDNRKTSRQRGYDSRWDNLRNLKRFHNPLCEECIRQGIYRDAMLVHHIKPLSEGGGLLDMNNLMSVCEECHARLHANKMNGNDVDGNPIDPNHPWNQKGRGGSNL